MQDYFESRGKVFLYVITPSKVAQQSAIHTEWLQLPRRGEGPLGQAPVV